MGNRIKGKVKRKSIKTKSLDINSKRRLAKFGKKKKTGHEGEAIRYVTRSRAIKKLGITIRDFRRLCILKGIYPREPRSAKLAQRTVYHVKDITFLSHEPLLERFRLYKAFMKKVNRHLNRKDEDIARKMYNENRPTYTLTHLVRERYPRFVDTLADLDDALCLLHLFASVVPSIGAINAERSENCLRLCREWQLFVVKSQTLRKSFVSIKGIYYQAEIMGQEITWIVPHKFAQNKPKEVDVKVMSTFLEFYECLMGFVLFKLYHNIGMAYPPKLDQALDESGAHLECIQLERLKRGLEDEKVIRSLSNQQDDDEEEDIDDGPSDDEEDDETQYDETTQQQRSKDRISTLGKRLQEIIVEEQKESDDIIMQENDEKNKENDNEEDEDDGEAVFAEDEQAKMVAENSKKIKALTQLFKNCTFWISREVPFEPLEFVIRSFGGKVAYDGNGNIEDNKITHVVTDRPKVVKLKNREYIQPQWVFDSTNFRLLLPTNKYQPGVVLPPHLSPFVDNEAVGYTPEYAEEIAKLQAAVGVEPEKFVPPTLLRDTIRKDDLDVDQTNNGNNQDEDDADDKEEEFVKGIKEELLGQKKRKRAEENQTSLVNKKSSSNNNNNASQDDETLINNKKRKLLIEQEKQKLIQNEDDDLEMESEESEIEEEEEEEQKREEEEKKKKKKEKKEEEKRKKKKEKEEEEASLSQKGKDYIAAKKFKGSKEGYIFKVGFKGLGYYIDENKNRPITFKKSKVQSKREKLRSQRMEEKERAKMMMSNKAKRLYRKMDYGIKRKKENAQQLRKRRQSKN